MSQFSASSQSIQAHIKKSTNGRYQSLQGSYNPRVGGPYKGPSKKPIFRSKLELRLMVMLDSPNANNVISWQYEPLKIPYQDKSTVEISKSGLKTFPTRHYIIDFVVKLKHGESIRTFWIEVKSVHDIEVNKKRKNTKNAKISEKIRIKNYCKWMSASKAAKLSDASFIVVTEKELDALKNMMFN